MPFSGRNDLDDYDMTEYSPTATTTTSNSGDFNDDDFGSDKMKLIYFSNEFPHDDQHKLLRLLHQHSKDRRHPILARFLDEATLAIRDEVRQLPVALAAQIPPFESVLNFADFADLRRQSSLCESINGVLLCIIEIGTFIG